ncbi:hypothetical protein RIF29_15706 [Crotalaria pallida]|uniref:PPM-type phosphatase domain-containing protein n=1 Tax=Crotalaria pallida TaxID=3830 RepID=A0AAN9FFA1_CROPI
MVKAKLSDVSVKPVNVIEDCQSDFLPKLCSRAYADIGFKSTMEYGRRLLKRYMANGLVQVFDGHGGKHAVDFAFHHLPKYILEDENFPSDIERIVTSAFLQTDKAFAEACSLDAALASGTTALAALVIGMLLVVANVGDCRAVLCHHGKAIEMSRDHKPICSKEKKRIEASGGYIYDGYLNGQLNVARALGDWHMEKLSVENFMNGKIKC